MQVCIEEAQNLTAKRNCVLDDDVKATLKSSLERVRVRCRSHRVVNDAARDSAGEAMRLCRTTASDDTAKAACANTVKDTLASTLGKDASSIEAFEVNDFEEGDAEETGDK